MESDNDIMKNIIISFAKGAACSLCVYSLGSLMVGDNIMVKSCASFLGGYIAISNLLEDMQNYKNELEGGIIQHMQNISGYFIDIEGESTMQLTFNAINSNNKNKLQILEDFCTIMSSKVKNLPKANILNEVQNFTDKAKKVVKLFTSSDIENCSNFSADKSACLKSLQKLQDELDACNIDVSTSVKNQGIAQCNAQRNTL